MSFFEWRTMMLKCLSISADFDQFRQKRASLQRFYWWKSLENFIPAARTELQKWKLASGCKRIFEKIYKRRTCDFLDLIDLFFEIWRKNWNWSVKNKKKLRNSHSTAYKFFEIFSCIHLSILMIVTHSIQHK